MTAISLADVVKAYDVRGIVPDQLDARVTRALGAAFAEVVVLGHTSSDDRHGHGHDSDGHPAHATPAPSSPEPSPTAPAAAASTSP